jgi:hypothetical protein
MSREFISGFLLYSYRGFKSGNKSRLRSVDSEGKWTRHVHVVDRHHLAKGTVTDI